MKKQLNSFNKELYYLNSVYHLLKELEKTEEITKDNIEEKVRNITDYKFKKSTIKLLKDDYFKTS